MGVGACIFAKKTKRYLYFDREYNIYPMGSCSEEYGPLRGEHAECPREKVLALLQEAALEHCLDPGYWHCIHWCAVVRDFVLAMPEDEVFFTVSDNDNPANWEIEKEGGYTEWPDKTVKLTPEQQATADNAQRDVMRELNSALRGEVNCFTFTKAGLLP